MKSTLTEMKNILQGINSEVDETENQIKDLEGSRKHPIRTAKRKKNQKTMRIA